MRKIEITGQFKKDYKREIKGRYKQTLEQDLKYVFELLVLDSELPQRLRDHPMLGEWKDYRDCHIKPDLVLIYRKPGMETLQLVRLGPHSHLSI